MPAWQASQGGIVTFWDKGDGRSLLIPCGTCIGCKKSQSQAWALRCILELQDHNAATFTTLTYSPEHEPRTLQKRHLQLFQKRLRKKSTRTIRVFASGEYGEKNGRPHYHAILFGASAVEDANKIQVAWNMGNAYTIPATPATIGYTAGYCAKKYNRARLRSAYEHIDTETGEITYSTKQPDGWQDEFIQMSRNPGIGANARQHQQSWKDYAVINGTRIPVPKYFHKAWEQIATEGEKEEHNVEVYLRSLTKERITKEHLTAQELILDKMQELTAAKRKL